MNILQTLMVTAAAVPIILGGSMSAGSGTAGLTPTSGTAVQYSPFVSLLRAVVDIDTNKQQAVYEKYTVKYGELSRRFVEGPTTWNYGIDYSAGKRAYSCFGHGWESSDIEDLRIRVSLTPGASYRSEKIREMDERTEFYYDQGLFPDGVLMGNGATSHYEAGSGYILGYYTRVIKGENYRPEEIGDYIEEVTAINGSLPADGKGEDGFWYVFKGTVAD